MKLRTTAAISALFFSALVGFLALGRLLPTRWTEVLDRAGILLGYMEMCVIVTIAAWGLWQRPRLRSRLGRWLAWVEHRNRVVSIGRLQGRVEAMVIPVSRREQPEWILRHLRPRRVALLYSRETERVATRLAKDFGSETVFHPPAEAMARSGLWLDNPYDPEESRRLVGHFLEELGRDGVARERTFVDTTGGTVPMSIGSFQAAEEQGVPTLYVLGTGRLDERTGLILDPCDPGQGEPRVLRDPAGVTL